MAARLRPARTSAIRREASPVAEDQEIARDASHGQGVGNSRGDGQPSRHFAGCVCETGRPRWKNQIGPTPRRWASQPAVSAAMHPSAGHHSATLQRRGVGESCHRAGATMPGHESRRPDKISRASRLRCHAGVLPGHYTTHIVRDPPVIYSGRTGNPETLCWK